MANSPQELIDRTCYRNCDNGEYELHKTKVYCTREKGMKNMDKNSEKNYETLGDMLDDVVKESANNEITRILRSSTKVVYAAGQRDAFNEAVELCKDENHHDLIMAAEAAESAYTKAKKEALAKAGIREG